MFDLKRKPDETLSTRMAASATQRFGPKEVGEGFPGLEISMHSAQIYAMTLYVHSSASYHGSGEQKVFNRGIIKTEAASKLTAEGARANHLQQHTGMSYSLSNNRRKQRIGVFGANKAGSASPFTGSATATQERLLYGTALSSPTVERLKISSSGPDLTDPAHNQQMYQDTVKRRRLFKALSITEGKSVNEDGRRMAMRRVDAALLTDESAFRSGLITDKEVATRVIAEGLKPSNTPASKVIMRNVPEEK